ncbi:hypothetical protein SNEBB_003567 [Seison nebaliae]|nr:hypothetical protein SNEBB_003567 [Seison nebaliae]
MKENSIIGKVILGVTGVGAVGLTVVAFPFVTPAFRRIALPYLPATDNQLKNITSALKKIEVSKQRLRVVDVGSGDGRVVRSISSLPTVERVDGVELNYWLIIYSRWKSFICGNAKNQFFRRDMFKFNYQPYNVVVIFGMENMMDEIGTKFLKDLKKNSYIIACRFPLHKVPDELNQDQNNNVIGGFWKPIYTVNSDESIDNVWVYKV